MQGSFAVGPSINNSLRMEDLDVVLGQPLHIECDASGTPEPAIIWLREGEPLSYLGNPNLRLEEEGRRLRIYNAELLDIGRYTCFATNAAGNASKEFMVNVLVPPTIEDSPSSVIASVGSRSLLVCTRIRNYLLTLLSTARLLCHITLPYTFSDV